MSYQLPEPIILVRLAATTDKNMVSLVITKDTGQITVDDLADVIPKWLNKLIEEHNNNNPPMVWATGVSNVSKQRIAKLPPVTPTIQSGESRTGTVGTAGIGTTPTNDGDKTGDRIGTSTGNEV